MGKALEKWAVRSGTHWLTADGCWLELPMVRKTFNTQQQGIDAAIAAAPFPVRGFEAVRVDEPAEAQWVRDLRVRADRGEVRVGDRLINDHGVRARVCHAWGDMPGWMSIRRADVHGVVAANAAYWRIVGERMGWVVATDDFRGRWRPEHRDMADAQASVIAGTVRARVRYLPGCSPRLGADTTLEPNDAAKRAFEFAIDACQEALAGASMSDVDGAVRKAEALLAAAGVTCYRVREMATRIMHYSVAQGELTALRARFDEMQRANEAREETMRLQLRDAREQVAAGLKATTGDVLWNALVERPEYDWLHKARQTVADRNQLSRDLEASREHGRQASAAYEAAQAEVHRLQDALACARMGQDAAERAMRKMRANGAQVEG